VEDWVKELYVCEHIAVKDSMRRVKGRITKMSLERERCEIENKCCRNNKRDRRLAYPINPMNASNLPILGA
jgi:hypothetical protein